MKTVTISLHLSKSKFRFSTEHFYYSRKNLLPLRIVGIPSPGPLEERPKVHKSRQRSTERRNYNSIERFNVAVNILRPCVCSLRTCNGGVLVLIYFSATGIGG